MLRLVRGPRAALPGHVQRPRARQGFAAGAGAGRGRGPRARGAALSARAPLWLSALLGSGMPPDQPRLPGRQPTLRSPPSGHQHPGDLVPTRRCGPRGPRAPAPGRGGAEGGARPGIGLHAAPCGTPASGYLPFSTHRAIR